jgi:hypothetical protein
VSSEKVFAATGKMCLGLVAVAAGTYLRAANIVIVRQSSAPEDLTFGFVMARAILTALIGWAMLAIVWEFAR